MPLSVAKKTEAENKSVKNNIVYILNEHNFRTNEDKIVGIFSREDKAQKAKTFKEDLNGFESAHYSIFSYELDKMMVEF